MYEKRVMYGTDYDVGIVGAGLAGLTAAYRIAQIGGAKRIVIWEQSDRVGGRVGTYHYDPTNPEALTELGAAVLSVDIHKRLLPLMEELGFDLHRDFTGAAQSTAYALRQPLPLENAKRRRTTLADQTSGYHLKAIEHALLRIAGSGIFKTLGAVARLVPRHTLQQFTLGTLLSDYFFFSPDFVALLRDAFGYNTAFDVLNAWDALREIEFFQPKHGFMSFKPGLSTFVDRLAERVQELGVELRINHAVRRLTAAPNGEFVAYVHHQQHDNGWDVEGEQKAFWCDTPNPNLAGASTFPFEESAIRVKSLILALPAAALTTLLTDLPAPLADAIQPVALMRVYLQFDEPWFRGLPQTNKTSTPARMIFQMSEQDRLVQIYTDEPDALFWYEHLRNGTLSATAAAVLSSIFPDRHVPLPVCVWTNFCPFAAHMWRAGYDSTKIAPYMLQPFGVGVPLFVCGEGYSTHQGWMEGAVETAEQVVRKWSRVHMEH